MSPISPTTSDACQPASSGVSDGGDKVRCSNESQKRFARSGIRVRCGQHSLNGLLLLTALCLLAALPSPAQESGSASATSPDQASPAKQPPESEFIVEGQGSFGNYKIFAAGEGSRLFTGGVEYERHSWGHFLGAQVYYVGEILPVVLLDEPDKLDYYGNPHSKDRHLVPGLGIIPIGFRLLWLHDRKVEFYMMGKGGIFGFTQKVLSPSASYEDFILHSEIGTQIRMTQKTDLRLGIGDFHFSNAFITPSNPGLDVMAYDAGICYRFQRTRR